MLDKALQPTRVLLPGDRAAVAQRKQRVLIRRAIGAALPRCRARAHSSRSARRATAARIRAHLPRAERAGRRAAPPPHQSAPSKPWPQTPSRHRPHAAPRHDRRTAQHALRRLSASSQAYRPRGQWRAGRSTAAPAGATQPAGAEPRSSRASYPTQRPREERFGPLGAHAPIGAPHQQTSPRNRTNGYHPPAFSRVHPGIGRPTEPKVRVRILSGALESPRSWAFLCRRQTPCRAMPRAGTAPSLRAFDELEEVAR